MAKIIKADGDIISIGTDEEMDTLFRFLEAYLPNA